MSKKDLRFTQFKNQNKELIVSSYDYINWRFHIQNTGYENERTVAFFIGKSVGEIFKFREFFYDNFDWRF